MFFKVITTVLVLIGLAGCAGVQPLPVGDMLDRSPMLEKVSFTSSRAEGVCLLITRSGVLPIKVENVLFSKKHIELLADAAALAEWEEVHGVDTKSAPSDAERKVAEETGSPQLTELVYELLAERLASKGEVVPCTK